MKSDGNVAALQSRDQPIAESVFADGKLNRPAPGVEHTNQRDQCGPFPGQPGEPTLVPAVDVPAWPGGAR
jgi:hypothetical protein